jgi:hypothetical protein
MPDPTSDGTSDRAELAFRDAFTRYADDLEPRELVAPTQRRRLLEVVAAAAAVAVVAGATWFDIAADPPGATPPTVGTPATSSVEVTPDKRWATFHDVEVQVPSSWGDADPQDPWCLVRESPASGPYVERSGTDQLVPAIGCAPPAVDVPGFPEYATDLWQPHLTFTPTSSSLPVNPPTDGTHSYEDWTLTVRTVGDVRVSLLTDRATRPLAEQIIGSARRVREDWAGCPVTSPVQQGGPQRPAPHDLAATARPSGVAICQYEIGGPDGRGAAEGPGLVGSRVLGADGAGRLRDAILAGKTGGGPHSPRECVDDFYWGTTIVLRFAAPGQPVTEVYAYTRSCVENGFDDGVVKRALTSDSCRPLYGERIAQYSFSPATYGLCHTAR